MIISFLGVYQQCYKDGFQENYVKQLNHSFLMPREVGKILQGYMTMCETFVFQSEGIQLRNLNEASWL